MAEEHKQHGDDNLYANDPAQRAAKGTDLGSVGTAHGNLVETTTAEVNANAKAVPDTTEVADSVRRHLEPEI